MIKPVSMLEVKVGEKVFQLYCAPDSTLGELYDATSQMKGYAIQRMQEAEKPVESGEKPLEIVRE